MKQPYEGTYKYRQHKKIQHWRLLASSHCGESWRVWRSSAYRSMYAYGPHPEHTEDKSNGQAKKKSR